MQFNHSAFQLAKFASANDAQTAMLLQSNIADILTIELADSGEFAVKVTVLVASLIVSFELESSDHSVQKYQVILQHLNFQLVQ